jgi:hypothetical protein
MLFGAETGEGVGPQKRFQRDPLDLAASMTALRA